MDLLYTLQNWYQAIIKKLVEKWLTAIWCRTEVDVQLCQAVFCLFLPILWLQVNPPMLEILLLYSTYNST